MVEVDFPFKVDFQRAHSIGSNAQAQQAAKTLPRSLSTRWESLRKAFLEKEGLHSPLSAAEL
eukprot:scaffold440_cov277-Ochromonas_danica.AAC.27